MRVRATRDTYEREADEAERLVKPSPKVKPSRKDRERHTVHPDRDADVSGDSDTKSDPDMSLNYKTVGGSVTHRVLGRYLTAKGDQVSVRRKDTGRIVYITPEYLKEHSTEYEKVVPTKGTPEKGLPESPPRAPEVKTAPSEAPANLAVGEQLRSLAKSHPQAAQIFNDLLNPKSSLAYLTKTNPNYSVEPIARAKGFTLPAELKTIGQLQAHLWAAKKEGPKKAPREPVPGVKKRPPETSAPSPKRAPRAVAPEQEVPRAVAPEQEVPRAVAPEQDVPRAVAPEQDVPRAVAPEQTAPKAVAPEQTAPKAVAPEQTAPKAEDVLERFQATTLKTPEFKSFGESLPTSDIGPDGTVLFLDRSTKPKRHVPFSDLPAKAQSDVVDRFQGQQRDKAQSDFVAALLKSDPKMQTVLSDVASLGLKDGPDGPIGERLQKLVQEGHALDELPLRKHIPELGEVKLPAGLSTVADLVRATKGVAKPKLKRKDFSEERASSLRDRGAVNFPWPIALELQKLHPQDQETVLKQFDELRHAAVKDTQQALEGLEKVYQTDPDKIPPPTHVEHKGKSVPLANLSPEDQVEAIQQHKNKVLAISLAGRWLVKDGLRGKGVPQNLLDMISMPWEKPPAPEKVFADAMGDGKKEPLLPKSRVKNILADLPETQQATASAYFQARDYQDAKRRYLETNQINEHLAPRAIVQEISKATSELRDRETLYPKETWVNTAKRFRARVLTLLKARKPKKYDAVRPWVLEQDAKEYEKARSKWEASTEKGKGPPPFPPEGYWELEGRPKAKTKPPNFWHSLKSLLPQGAVQAEKVASRYLSTCTEFSLMRTAPSYNKHALYWGVAPYPAGRTGFEPYNEWSQAHARDLTITDFTAILKGAREWLKNPGLSEVPGMGPDVRYRAALDLALRTLEDGKYSVGLHPAQYNELLAKLAGEAVDQTLLTIREASASNVSRFKSLETSMQPSSILRKYAAQLAGHNPAMAFNLMATADQVEQVEQAAQASGDQKQKAAGQMPPALKKHMEEKKKEEAGDDDDDDAGQQKQAYVTLRSAVIRTASSTPEARKALMPILKVIQQLG